MRKHCVGVIAKYLHHVLYNPQWFKERLVWLQQWITLNYKMSKRCEKCKMCKMKSKQESLSPPPGHDMVCACHGLWWQRTGALTGYWQTNRRFYISIKLNNLSRLTQEPVMTKKKANRSEPLSLTRSEKKTNENCLFCES